jgi:hypothetical protein
MGIYLGNPYLTLQRVPLLYLSLLVGGGSGASRNLRVGGWRFDGPNLGLWFRPLAPEKKGCMGGFRGRARVVDRRRLWLGKGGVARWHGSHRPRVVGAGGSASGGRRDRQHRSLGRWS